MPSLSGQVVCVTGAGGFIASWLVKLLLQKGYTVRGTVRNPDDEKNGHLKQLEGASERLTLWKADLLDYQSLRQAINGCDGVFHTASPVTDDPEQMVEPAVIGTKNVIAAAAEGGVRRVVFTSSIGAVYMDPNRGPDEVVDETCWSDLEFCKNTKSSSVCVCGLWSSVAASKSQQIDRRGEVVRRRRERRGLAASRRLARAEVARRRPARAKAATGEGKGGGRQRLARLVCCIFSSQFAVWQEEEETVERGRK